MIDAEFPAHWRSAAKALQIRLGGAHYIPTPGKKVYGDAVDGLLITFKLDESRDWASTSLQEDVMYGWAAERALGLPAGSIPGGVLARQVSLNPVKISANDFRVRYPDVPYKQAHQFVLLHELGHCLHGWTEQAADDYAFKRILLPPSKVGSEKRALWYSTMKHPASRIFAP